MTVNCDVIADLLPLYADGVCSEESTKIVEEHLKICKNCKELLSNLQDDKETDTIVPDGNEVMAEQKKVFRRHSMEFSLLLCGIFFLPIFVCLIVNLATGMTLDWFFIVLTSLMLAASLIVVPIYAKKHKFLYASVLSLISIGALLCACAFYTHGGWFFFTYAAVLFGFSVFVLPFLLKEEALAEKVCGFRVLIVTGSAILTSAFLLLALYAYLDSPVFLRLALSLYLPLLVWCVCVVVLRQFFKRAKLLYLGLSSVFTGIFALIFESFSNALLGIKTPLPAFPKTLSGFPFSRGSSWLFFLSFSALGVVFIVISLLKRGKPHEN